MKIKALSFALTLIALFTFGAAQAQNAHFTDIVVSEDGMTITGKVAGLGNKFTGKDITVTYSGAVIAEAICYNSQGKETNAGKPGKSETSGSYKVAAKNGNVNFTLTLTAPSNLEQPTCKPDANAKFTMGEITYRTTTGELKFEIEGTTVTGTFTL